MVQASIWKLLQNALPCVTFHMPGGGGGASSGQGDHSEGGGQVERKHSDVDKVGADQHGLDDDDDAELGN